MKKKQKSLNLKKLTLTNLNDIEASKAVGGTKLSVECETPNTNVVYCYTEVFTCLPGCI